MLLRIYELQPNSSIGKKQLKDAIKVVLSRHSHEWQLGKDMEKEFADVTFERWSYAIKTMAKALQKSQAAEVGHGYRGCESAVVVRGGVCGDVSSEDSADNSEINISPSAREKFISPCQLFEAQSVAGI